MSGQRQIRVHVDCYAGYKANERPRTVCIEGHRLAVIEVLDRWYEGRTRPTQPAIDCFKVRTEDGRVWRLRYNSLFDVWTATP